MKMQIFVFIVFCLFHKVLICATLENTNYNTENFEISVWLDKTKALNGTACDGDVKNNCKNDKTESKYFGMQTEPGKIYLKRISILTASEPFKSEATDMHTSESSMKNEKFKYKNVTKSSTRNSILPFLEIPKGDDMRIQELRLDEEYLLFGAFSTLMGFLQPSGFPSDLLRESVNKRLPLYLLTLQVLKMDIMVVVWVIIWAIASLCFPMAMAAQLCCPDGIERLNDDYSIGPFASSVKCTERFLGYLLHILLFLLTPAIILILASNQQMSRSISRSPLSANIIYGDINTFLRNTHMQISFVVSSSTDIAIESIRGDLEDVGELLGQPLQQELAAEVGIDLALMELEELRISTSQVTSMVSDLLTDCTSAKIAGIVLEEKLHEISRQLTVFKQQCSTKDRALCYTLQYTGFEVLFSFENLTNEPKIRHLDTLAREETLNSSVEAARETFASIPDQVALETTSFITDARAILSRKRTEVYKSTHALDVLTRSLSETLRVSEESSSKVIRDVANLDSWRWLCVIAVTSLISLVWSILLCGAPCGCGITSRTVKLLLSGVISSSMLCLFVWGLGSVSAFVGGHLQGFICNPLFDFPHYDVLSELFDSGGIFYEDSIFGQFSNGNDTIRVGNVLKQCQRYSPVYQTFHLNNTINIDTITNYKRWDDLTALFLNLTNEEYTLEILSPSLQLNLQGLSSATAVNLTSYRIQASAPVTRRDLNSFADQLNTVARQLNDAGTARKIDNLAFSVRKIIQNELKKMQEIKHLIMYKVTALEVLLPPINKQVNQSLEDLKNVQYFLVNKGFQIAQTVRTRFVTRLTSYLEDLFNYTTNKVTKEIGKCRPLWEIFHSTRLYVCRLIVDPLNAMAFSSCLIIILFITIAPIVLKLIEYYRQYDNEISSISSRNGLLDEESAWASPLSGTPPEIQLVETVPPVSYERPTTSTWTSPTPPRQPSPRRIPPPPRPPPAISRTQPPRIPEVPSISTTKSPKTKLATISSRFSKARQITQKAISGPRSPRRGCQTDSMKLVEPICWKAGSTTPRSWI